MWWHENAVRIVRKSLQSHYPAIVVSGVSNFMSQEQKHKLETVVVQLQVRLRMQKIAHCSSSHLSFIAHQYIHVYKDNCFIEFLNRSVRLSVYQRLSMPQWKLSTLYCHVIWVLWDTSICVLVSFLGLSDTKTSYKKEKKWWTCWESNPGLLPFT